MEDENDAKASLAEQIKSLRSQCKRKGVKWVDLHSVKSSMASSPGNGGKRRSVGEDTPLPITLKGDEAPEETSSPIKDDSGVKKGEIKMGGDMKKDLER